MQVRNYFLKYPVLIIFFGFFIFSCSQTTENKETVKEDQLSETVKEISDETYSNIVSITEDGVIRFSGKPAQINNLKAGDIIVSDPMDLAESGFLKKVASVTEENGNLIIHTTDATLVDVFESLSLNETHALSVQNIEKIEYHIPGVMLKPGDTKEKWYISAEDAVLIDLDSDPETTYNNVSLEGSLELTPSFNLQLEIDEGVVQEIVFSTNLNEVADLTLSVGGEFDPDPVSKPILTAHFHPLTIWIGWFPLVIDPVIAIKIGADLRVEAKVEFHVVQTAFFETGLKYDGDWSTFQDFQKSFTSDDPEFTLNATAYGYVGPELSFLLYGVTGPYARLEGFLELDLDMFRTPAWQLYGGAKLLLGFDVSKISPNLDNPEEVEVISYRELLREAETVYGAIVGSVLDASTNQPIDNVRIDIYSGTEVKATGYTESDGSYRVEVPVGENYFAKFSKSGYIETVYEGIIINAIADFNLQQLLQIDESYAGYGYFGGLITNALSGFGVDGISLNLRDGMNNQTGTVIGTTSTSGGGYYSFSNIPAGNYTVEVSATGYTTTYFSAICLGNTTTSNQNASITPEMSASEIRVVLTWGANPDDLDSHLTGPTSSNDRFHVYYSNKTYSYGGLDIANLDVDDIYSYGPETITIYNVGDGLYRYSVHDYSNKSSSNSYALSGSDAQVRLYQGSQLVNTYYVPSNQEGTLWTVFEIQDGNVVTINNMSYESSSSGIGKVGSIGTDANFILNQADK